LREEIARTTKKDRRDAVINLIRAAADAFESGRYPAARQKLLEAKKLSSRAGAVRELLGLSSYRMGLWEESLRELRTYRRITGDTRHMAVEMDAQRALGRDGDVHKTWESFGQLGGSPGAESEMRVVYGSFLLDNGDAQGAWQATRPKRLVANPPDWELRMWYVAARAAARLGDAETAKQLADGIEQRDPAFPGMDELRSEISGSSDFGGV
jgi:hypothetical protein